MATFQVCLMHLTFNNNLLSNNLWNTLAETRSSKQVVMVSEAFSFFFFFVFTGSFDCMLLFLFCFDRQILIALFYLLWLPFFMVSNIFKILFSILIFFYYITPTLTFSSASSMVLLVSDMPLWDHFHLDLKRSGTTKLVTCNLVCIDLHSEQTSVVGSLSLMT